MNILVTAGNTFVPIDRVRVITNVFSGRTGTAIALHCQQRGHAVTLLTSRPDLVSGQAISGKLWPGGLTVETFRTFNDLNSVFEQGVASGMFDAVIHCAAVSDHQVAGIFAPAPGTRFDPEQNSWVEGQGGRPLLEDRSAGKIKSSEPELWVRLIPTAKLADEVHSKWGFGGILVKFKLEVGIADEELLRIAEASRRQSQADLMVANTLEGVGSWAYLGPVAGRYDRISRRDLPERLLAAVENLHNERSLGQ
jgi:phosphopantothenate---cysteine ligase (CTP)